LTSVSGGAVAINAATNKELRDELNDVKRKYFFALAMETKLHLFNNRKNCNVDISDLYQAAVTQNIPHTSWGGWLYQQFNHYTKTASGAS